MAIEREAGRRQPRRHRIPRRLATSHANLGVLLSRGGPAAEAEAEYRAALAIFRRSWPTDNPAVTDFRLRPGGQPQRPRPPAFADGPD